MVNNKVANAKSTSEGMTITKGYLKRTLILTIPLVIVASLIPEKIYFLIFGIEGIATPIKLLAPGMIAGAISSIIAHHLSGVGLHKWNAFTSGLALVVLLCVGNYLIPIMEVCGAAIAASCAYSAQALGLIVVWKEVVRMRP